MNVYIVCTYHIYIYTYIPVLRGKMQGSDWRGTPQITNGYDTRSDGLFCATADVVIV